MFEFDGSPIYDQDTVYVVGMGPGKVIDVKSTGFRIRVAGRTRKVSFRGVQSGESFQSVYWHNPVTHKPAKNNTLWGEQKKLALAACNALASAVVGQELIQIIEDEPEPVLTAEANQAALLNIIEEARENEARRIAESGNVTNIPTRTG